MEISAFVTGISRQILRVLQHTGIFPAVIDLTCDPDTGTQSAFIIVGNAAFTFMVSIQSTELTCNFNIIRFFLQSCNTYAETVQFVSKFSCQTIYVSAFGHCFSNDLSHFVTGHQTIAAESAVAITVNDTS